MALNATGYWHTADPGKPYGLGRGTGNRTRGAQARARRMLKRDWRRAKSGQSFKAYMRSLATNGVQQ